MLQRCGRTVLSHSHLNVLLRNGYINQATNCPIVSLMAVNKTRPRNFGPRNSHAIYSFALLRGTQLHLNEDGLSSHSTPRIKPRSFLMTIILLIRSPENREAEIIFVLLVLVGFLTS